MTYYEMLRVAPGATEDEIRSAYLAAAREFHPDRIDQAREPDRWQQANEIMSALNEAYGVLGDEGSRRDYDAYLCGERPARPSVRVAPPPVDLSELSAGTASVSQLDPALRERLYRRVSSDDLPGFRVALGWPRTIWISLVIALDWVVWVVFRVDGPRWSENAVWETWKWGGLAALLLGVSSYKLYRRARYPLGRHLLFTPLHIVETDYDTVSYWPLWTMRDFKATEHYTNGGYTSTSVQFSAGDKPLSFSLSSKAAFQKFASVLRELHETIAAAQAQQAWTYFFANNDFRDLAPPPMTRTRPWLTPLKFAAGAAAGVALLCVGGGYVNARLAARAPVDEGAATAEVQTDERPASGDTITYQRHAATVPVEIRAPAGQDCLVSFAQQSDGADALAVYVRRGEVARVLVPPGEYGLREATGEGWTGYKTPFRDGLARRTAARPFFAREGAEPGLKIDQALFNG